MNTDRTARPWYETLRRNLCMTSFMLGVLLNVDESTVDEWDRRLRRPGPGARTHLRVLWYLAEKARGQGEAKTVGREIVAHWHDAVRNGWNLDRARGCAWRYIFDYLHGPAKSESEPVCWCPDVDDARAEGEAA